MKRKMKLIGVYDYTVILTYCSLFSAATGLGCAIQGRFTASVLCLLLSGVCDAFDGIVARSKKDRTEEEKAFGIQLDSLCDVVSFGVAPAFCCYCTGMDSTLGSSILCIYCICAVIRLAYFNVLEAKRQQVEAGSNKYYRGLPVTTASMLLPVFYILRFFIGKALFSTLFCILLAAMALLFVLDFSVKKIDWLQLLGLRKKERQL